MDPPAVDFTPLDHAILEYLKTQKGHPVSSPELRRLASTFLPGTRIGINTRLIEYRMKHLIATNQIKYVRLLGRYIFGDDIVADAPPIKKAKAPNPWK